METWCLLCMSTCSAQLRFQFLSYDRGHPSSHYGSFKSYMMLFSGNLDTHPAPRKANDFRTHLLKVDLIPFPTPVALRRGFNT